MLTTKGDDNSPTVFDRKSVLLKGGAQPPIAFLLGHATAKGLVSAEATEQRAKCFLFSVLI